MKITRTQETLLILAAWVLFFTIGAGLAVIAWRSLLPNLPFVWLVFIYTIVWSFTWSRLMKIYQRRWEPRIIFRC
jgi:hypothetical protein